MARQKSTLPGLTPGIGQSFDSWSQQNVGALMNPMWSRWYDQAWEATGGETDQFGNKNINLAGSGFSPEGVNPVTSTPTVQMPSSGPAGPRFFGSDMEMPESIPGKYASFRGAGPSVQAMVPQPKTQQRKK